MAQLEDGYTRIANEILEAIIRYPFTKRELKIVLAVIRKTYGYNKKTDSISLSQLVKLTGLAKSHVSETVTELGTKGVLTVCKENFIQVIGFNKKYREWVPKTGTVPKTGIRGSQNGNRGVPKTGTTKDNFTKDNIQKTDAEKKSSPACMPSDWLPNENNQQWLDDSGLTDIQQQTVIRDFRDFWIQSKSKKKNWDLAFRKNPVVNRKVNTAQPSNKSEPWRTAI